MPKRQRRASAMALHRMAMSALAVALCAVTANTHAEGEKRVINAMAVTTFPPFEFADKSGKSVGLAIDMLNSMAAKIGAQVNWTQSGFDQLASFAPLKTKRADVLLGGMADTPERHADANFLDYIYLPYAFYTLRGSAGHFPNMDALCGKRVGAPRVSLFQVKAVEKWSEQNCVKVGKPGIIVVPGEHTPQIRLMVMQGFVDAGITGSPMITYLNTVEGNQYAIVGKPVVKQLTGMAFSKDNPQLGEELKKALAALMADGTYKQVLRKWGVTEEASIEQPMINGLP